MADSRPSILLSSRTFTARSRGFNSAGVWVVGPVVVEVRVEQVEGCWPSYYVWIDGRHQCGGVAGHLPESGIPALSFLEYGPEIFPRHDYFETVESLEDHGVSVWSLDIVQIDGEAMVPFRCHECGRPGYYDLDDDRYHHAVLPDRPCFLIPAEPDRAPDFRHPLLVGLAR